MKNRFFSKHGRTKILLAALLAIIMTTACFFVLFQNEKREKCEICLVSKQDKDMFICPLVKNDGSYLFIPSGFSLNDFELESDGKVLTDDLPAYEEKDELVLGTEHIRLIRSDRVPTLFIETLIGDLDKVDADIEKETAVRIKIDVFNDDSSRSANLSGKMSGHGNTSWLYYDKKPYNIALDESFPILSMSDSRKWCLISNSTQKYPTENEIVYAFANKLGMEYTPQCRYVNVYINGKYNGLYLLAEKIEAGQDKLDLDLHFSYLLETDLNQLPEKDNNYFVTEGNNVMEIKFPQTVSSSRTAQIKKEVQELEDSLLDLNSDAWMSLIDIKSWARVYLLDELFENLDGGFHSIYFYKDERGLFVRGPAWDFDRSFADRPDVILTGNEFKFSNQIAVTYNYYLLQREEFRKTVLQIFREEFLPLIDTYLKEDIRYKAELISKSAAANAIRWDLEAADPSYEETMIEYLKRRSAFLLDFYSHREEYCKVQIEDVYSAYYLKNFVVKKGEKLSDIEGLDANLLREKLYYKNNGILFNEEDIIDRDITLVRKLQYEKTVPNLDAVAEQSKLGSMNLLMIFGFSVMFLFAVYMVMKRFTNGKVSK